jgi:hypothetical protein
VQSPEFKFQYPLQNKTKCKIKLSQSRDRIQSGRKYLQTIHWTKGLISRIYKQLKKLNTKITIKLINGQMNWTVFKRSTNV